MATVYRDSIIYDAPGINYRGGPAASQDITSITLYNENGSYICEIPDVEDLTFQETLNDESSWSFKYPMTGSNFSNLVSEKDRFFAVRLPGGGYFWGYLEDDAWEEASQQDSDDRKATFSGRGTEGIFDYALVYPAAGVGGDPNQYSGYSFTNKTIGFIMKTLYVWAKVRGALPPASINFNEFKDSSQTNWIASNYSIDIPRGQTVLEVLKSLSQDLGWFDWRMNGLRLEIFDRNTATGMGKDRASAILRRGIHVQKMPRQRSRKELGTVVLGAGQDNLIVEVSDATAIAVRGRKEKFADQGNISDAAMLTQYSQTTLDGSSKLRLAKTASVAWGSIRPKTDFGVGDYVYVDNADITGNSKFRVISYSYAFKPKPYGELALNDRFQEFEVQLAQKLNRSQLAGGGGTPTEPVQGKDLGIPIAPGSVAFTSSTYEDSQTGHKVGQILIDWAEVTTNTDGTVANDIDSYFPEWKFASDSKWTILPATLETEALVQGLGVGKSVDVRVRARDEARHMSAYSLVFTGTVASDTTPPPLPSAPVIQENRLGVVTLAWNGLDSNGLAMPADFSHVNVYYSTINNFDLGVATKAGELRSTGLLAISNLTYGTNYNFRFTSEDVDGNESDLTDQTSATVDAVLGPDITPGSVTTNSLAAGAVTAAKIDTYTINANNATFGATTNMVPDPSFADATIRADRLLQADIPARWQWSNFSGGLLTSSSGFYLEGLPNATDRTTGFIPLTGLFGVHAYEKYYLKVWARRWSGNAGCANWFGLRVVRNDGSIVYRGGATVFPDGNWHRYYQTVELQPGDNQAQFVVASMEHTSGSVFFDEVECRNSTNNAAEVGSTSRIEITPSGIYAEASTGEETFTLDAETGDVFIRGQLISGFAGKRLEVNPTATYLPEIRFFASDRFSNSYAYINAVDSGNNQTPFIGVNAPDSGSPAKSMKLILTDTNFYLGEFQQNTLTSLGTAVVGDQGDGYLYTVGRMNSGPLNSRGLWTGGRFTTVNGVGSAGGTTTLTVTKPTLDGLSIPIVSLMRLTDLFFSYHVRNNSSASWQVRWQNHPTADNVTTWTDWLLFRGDDV